VIALIDYGAGNMRSVKKALTFIGAEVEVVSAGDRLAHAQAAVLPGVGAFDDCLNALEKQQLLDATRRFIDEGKPFLGICVGYQALFERSDEFNSCAAGLGLFKGSVVRFNSDAGLKIPQIGWNQVNVRRPDCPLFKNIPSGSYFYFVHSFFPKPVDSTIVAAETEYGDNFASAIWRDNVFATQFHPEKSQNAGLQLLRNFLDFAQIKLNASAS
jgi:imidazole glycerol-phosphate synthase subunit HisH